MTVFVGSLQWKAEGLGDHTFLVIMLMGKFQGVIAATTPMGCLIVIMRLLRSTVSKTSPVTRRHSSANHSTLAALQTNKKAFCFMLLLLLLVGPCAV